MSGFFGKIRDVFTLDDDYYEDEHDELDYDNYDDYDYDDYYEDDISEEYYDEPKQEEVFERSNNISSFETFQKHNKDSKGNKVQIKIHEPLEYNDAPKIIDDILSHRIAVLNLEMLERDKKNKVFDFVNGGIYALDAKIQKVSTDIFVIAPNGFNIDGKIKDQINSKGFYNL